MVSEDFPTPPLPDATPMTRVSDSGCANGMNFSRPPRNNFFTLLRCSSFMTPKSTSTLEIPETLLTAPVISPRNLSCIGHPEIVKRILSFATPCVISTDSTMPSSGSGRWSSGSETVASAALTCSSNSAALVMAGLDQSWR